MSSEPLISVVMIFLDAERFIAEAIDSVRAQTWPSWELLLVDDGSRDGSTAIARQYAAADPARIQYLEHAGHRNLGMSASRNLGASRAAGEWVAFLDSDDVWMPDALSMQMASLARHPEVELVYASATNWHSWDRNNSTPDSLQDLSLEPGVVDGARLAAHFVEHGVATPCHGAALIQRRAMTRLGGFEESFRGMYEDQVFWFKAALGARVMVGRHSGLLYRQHHDSCCSVEFRGNRHAAARLAFVRWANRYARRAGIRDSRLRTTLRRHLRAAWWSTGAPARVRRTVRGMLPDPFLGWLRACR